NRTCITIDWLHRSLHLVSATGKQGNRAGKDKNDKTLKPRLEMSNVNITNIGDDAIDLTMNLLIDNPLPVSFTAHQLDYSLAIAGQEVMKDAYKKPISIKSGDSTVVKLPAKLMGDKLTK